MVNRVRIFQRTSDLKGKGPLNDILADVILLGQVEKLPETKYFEMGVGGPNLESFFLFFLHH